MARRDFTETNEQFLETWDKGQPVSVIEMGGFSPGYEQCIQIAAIELLRKLKDDEYAQRCRTAGERLEDGKSAFFERMEKALHEIDRNHDLGMSGAQAGAAQNEAALWCLKGYDKAMNEAKAQVEDDRFLLVSRAWPNDKPVKNGASTKN